MASINLSDRQVELLKAVLEVMKADIDWPKVAELANMKTSKYARDQWTIVRNKLVASPTKATDNTKAGNGEGTSDAGTPTGKGGNKGTPRKRKADADDEETPAKKKAKPRKAKSETEAKTEGDGEPTVKEEPNEAGKLMDDMA